MENQFTKLNLNGVEKYVSAIYDGSGNNITSTYETKTDATSKENTLSERITTVSEALETLKRRVTATEEFNTKIESAYTKIQQLGQQIEKLKNVKGFLNTEDLQSRLQQVIALFNSDLKNAKVNIDSKIMISYKEEYI